MHPPPAVPPRTAALLAWSARLSDCADAARAQAVLLRDRVDERGLTGPAGDALAAVGRSVADELLELAARCQAAAGAITGAAAEQARSAPGAGR
ncbi:MAG: hypothetical protein ABIV05_06570 [Actinomycetota bacterium]